MRRWTRDRSAIDVRLMGYRSRRDIDRLNDRYSPRWWRRWRQRFSRFLGPEMMPVVVRSRWR